MTKLAPGSERAQLVDKAVSQAVAYAQSVTDDPQVKARGAAALAITGGVAELAATFKDNPGRRLISIYLGALIGVGCAFAFNLDIFTAILGHVGNHPGDPDYVFSYGVMLTGLAIGLGSNPTHELVKALQEYKNATKANAS